MSAGDVQKVRLAALVRLVECLLISKTFLRIHRVLRNGKGRCQRGLCCSGALDASGHPIPWRTMLNHPHWAHSLRSSRGNTPSVLERLRHNGASIPQCRIVRLVRFPMGRLNRIVRYGTYQVRG